MEDVEKDLGEMKVKRWQQKAANREEWGSVIKEAKTHRGQYSQEVRQISWLWKNFIYSTTWHHISQDCNLKCLQWFVCKSCTQVALTITRRRDIHHPPIPFIWRPQTPAPWNGPHCYPLRCYPSSWLYTYQV